MDSVKGLVGKWRCTADEIAAYGDEIADSQAYSIRNCADELEAALQAPGEAVGEAYDSCPTSGGYFNILVLGKKPVKDGTTLYTAPQPPPDDVLRRVVEALELAREFGSGLPHSLGYEFTHLPKIDAAIAAAHKALAEGDTK